MGRKNTNARERITPETMQAMVKRLNRENEVFRAHKRKEEFSLSYSVGSRIDESVMKRLSK